MDTDLATSVPKDFVDLRTEDLTSSQDVTTNNFEGEIYQNGIRVVASKTEILFCSSLLLLFLCCVVVFLCCVVVVLLLHSQFFFIC